MKKSLFAILFGFSVVLTAENAPIVKMAVFPDNTVFTVRKGVIPDGKNSLNFFEDTQFFKGSFNVWTKDVQFGIRNMPKKKFNSDVYSNPGTAFADQQQAFTVNFHQHTMPGDPGRKCNF